MTFKSVLIGLTLLLLAAFAALNWETIAAPANVSLGFTQLQAPLGLILLSFSLVLCALFMSYVLVLQATVILDTRRFTKALQHQRERADQAEASRLTELRSFIVGRLQQLQEQTAGVESRLKAEQGEAARSLSAHLGEIEDKLDRVLPDNHTPAR